MNQSDKLKESVSSYIEGELSGELRREFEQHMADDAEFKELVGRTRMVRERLQQLNPVSTSADFDATLRKRLNGYGNDGSRTFSMPQMNWRGPAIAVAATAVIASTVWLSSPTETNPVDAPAPDNVRSFAPNMSSQSVNVPDNETPDALVNENEDSLRVKDGQIKDKIKLVKDGAQGN